MEHSRQDSRGATVRRMRSGAPVGTRRRQRRKDNLTDRHQWLAFVRHYGSVIGMRVLLPVGLLLLLGFGALYFRLLQGPVSLKFLVEPVEEGIAAELPGLKPTVDDVVMALKSTGGLEFRLQNLKVSESDGDLVVAAPYAAMRLSPSAMLSLRAVPTRVELIEPQLFLTYSRGGGLKLQFSPASVPGGKLGGRYDGREFVSPPVPTAAQRRVNNHAGRDLGVSGGTASLEQIELSRVIAEFFQGIRAGRKSSPYLQAFGLRDATVILDHERTLSRWRIQQFAVNLDRVGDRNTMSGFANISSKAGPWSFTFRTLDSTKTNKIALDLSLDGFYPKTLGWAFPELSLLKPLDLPVSGKARLEMDRGGTLDAMNLELDVGAGRIHLPSMASAPVNIDSGQFAIGFDSKKQRLTLRPSTLQWGESSLTLAGVAEAAAPTAPGSAVAWVYDIRAQQGVMTVSEFGIPPTPIDEWRAQGSVQPNNGVVKLTSFKMVVGGGELVATGEIDTTGDDAGVGIEGQMSSMPVVTLAALWPRAFAPRARQLFGGSVQDGRVRTGSLKLLSGRFLRHSALQSRTNQRLAISIEMADVTIRPDQRFGVVQLPRALVRLESNALEVVVPKGQVILADNKSISLKSGRFTAINVDQLGAIGEIAFHLNSDLSSALTLLEQAKPDYVRTSAVDLGSATGKVDGEVRISFPLDDETSESDVNFGGKMRLSDGRLKKVFGNYDISGATIDFDVSQNSIDARGEVLLNGVLANVNWQRFLNASLDRQPPWRMTADLDDADRKQLDLDFGDALRGVVPIEFTIQPSSAAHRPVRLRADLSRADLFIEGLAWRKKPGRAAFLEADIVASGSRGEMIMENLKLAGDNIAIAGSARINEKNEVYAYEFPDFSLDLVTRLSVRGVKDKNKIWKVQAHGKTYDGRSFFRSLFNVGRVAGRNAHSLPKDGGIDLTAKIDNVLGYSDVSVRNATMKMSKRAGKLTALRAAGKLDGGQDVSVVYRKKQDRQRLLVANSTDAGSVFKLVGFYPNLVSGQMRLHVNLDGRGPAEKTGILWVEKFRILGDPLVTEVVSNANTGSGRKGKRQQKVIRQVFDFDKMRAPFSVGHGQFVLEDAYMRGPLIGATLRGKVDYNRKALNIGGTYIPLQGLNNAFSTIPLLGDLLSGPRKEGIFGMTFAIQGPMDRPQVLVNPFSFVAPGILREIFQLTPDAPSVKPLEKKSSTRNSNKSGARASSSTAVGEGRRKSRSDAARSNSIDGWTSRAQ